MKDTLSDTHALLIEDIDQENIVGLDCRYDTEFEWIAGEYEKLNSLTGNPDIDFKEIATISSSFLGKKSKDFRVLGWWINSQYKTLSKHQSIGTQSNQFTEIVCRFINKYLESGYPTKKTSKLTAIEWVIEELEPIIDEVQSDKNGSLTELLTNTDTILIDYFNEEAPNLLPSINRLKRRCTEPEKQEKKELKEKEEKPSVIQQFKEVASQVLHTHHDIDNKKTEQKAIRSLKQVSVDLIKYWSKNDSSEIKINAIVLLNRSAAWSHIEHVPSLVGNTTLLKPLPIGKQHYYRTNVLSEPSYDLYFELEETLQNTPFWLSGHVLVSMLLERLNLQSAANLTDQLLNNFIDRFPTVKELKFDDGSSFIDREDVEWLEQKLERKANPVVQANMQEINLEKYIENQVNEALSIYRSGKKTLAFQKFQDALGKVGSLRDEIQWRVGLLDLAINAKQNEIAECQIEIIKMKTEEIFEKQYDTKLELRFLLLWQKFLKLDSKKRNVNEKAERFVLQRICALDVCALI